MEHMHMEKHCGNALAHDSVVHEESKCDVQVHQIAVSGQFHESNMYDGKLFATDRTELEQEWNREQDDVQKSPMDDFTNNQCDGNFCVCQMHAEHFQNIKVLWFW